MYTLHQYKRVGNSFEPGVAGTYYEEQSACDARLLAMQANPDDRFYVTRSGFGADRQCPVTPWGAAQSVEYLMPGIKRVSTAGHGGYFVSVALRAVMPLPLRRLSAEGWFEEDCAWCAVALGFPHLFEPSAGEEARRTLINWYPEEARAMGYVFADSESYKLRDAARTA